MPYNLVGENGYETHGPTTLGMKALREFAAENEESCPALAQFVSYGASTDRKDALIVECGILARRKNTPENVRMTLNHLRKAAMESGSYIALVM